MSAPSTLLYDIKEDALAMKIIKDLMPGAEKMIAEGDAEFLSDTVNDLKKRWYAGFNEDNVSEIIKSLQTLKVDL